MEEKSDRKGEGFRTLWVWVILAFVILAGAWTTLIIIASQNQPEIIEIETP